MPPDWFERNIGTSSHIHDVRTIERVPGHPGYYEEDGSFAENYRLLRHVAGEH